MADYKPPKEVRLQAPSSRPIEVRHLDTPPTFVNPKRIHPRRQLPLVKEGVEREFHSTTRELALFRSSPMATGGELALVTNTELTSPGANRTASNVDEPSVAINGDVVVYTGNWYAAISIDAGRTFRFIDPATAFQEFDPPNSHFCCDQVVNYIKSIDTFVWLLQYGPDTGNNIQRLAFAKTSDAAQGRWHLFDITTESLGVVGAFMDFPDLAVGTSNLYVTTNIFGPGEQVGSAVVRLPFSGIDSGQVTARPFVSTDLQSFRVAQNCGTTAFFAAHQDSSTLEVFSWPENQNAPTPHAVGVARWIGGNGYQSRTADGRRWLDRADPRITGATVAGSEVWFAWGVDRGSNQRPKPFIQIARIDATNLTLLENINIFDADSATCYGALSTNADDEVGISYMLGGGPRNPSHVVGILTNDRKNIIVALGDRGPLASGDGKFEWGDYLTVRRCHPNEKLFAATGYTMKGSGDDSNRDVTPRFVVFGRASNAGSTGPGTDTTTIGGTTPFTDVNSLPVVNPTTAARILQLAKQAGVAPLVEPEQPLKFVNPELMTKPGVERWNVKTGQDPEVGLVGKNVFGNANLGSGIVPATVEELVRINRPADMTPPTQLFSKYQNKRRGPVEFVVWQIEGEIITLKLEADGDYHLVVQGASGDTMIAEVPTGTKQFVGTSPWLGNIKAARDAVDQKLVRHLDPASFVQLGDTLVPRASVSSEPRAMDPRVLPKSFATPPEGQEQTVPTFKTAVKPTAVRITGVGFFDRVHDQTGVALLNGIEIHSVLKIEWL